MDKHIYTLSSLKKPGLVKKPQAIDANKIFYLKGLILI